MKSQLGRVMGVTTLVLAASVTWAGERKNHGSNWARVTSVEPIYQRTEYKTPYETCWTERVQHQNHYRAPESDNLTGTVLGGVVGGAIGHAVGHRKRNKQVGAVVGTLVGATLGRDISRRSQSEKDRTETYYTNERRCDTRYDIEYREETVGYWVTYKYHGNEYRSRMRHHPGDKLRVRVHVEPY